MLVTCRVNVPSSLHLPRSTCRVPPAGSTRGVGSTCGPHVPCGSTYRLDMPQLPPRHAVFVLQVPIAVSVHLPRRRAVLVPLVGSTRGVGSTCGPNVRVGSTCRLDRPCRFHLRSTSVLVHYRLLTAHAASTGRVASTCRSNVPCSVHLPLRRAVVSPPAASTRRTALVGTARWGGRSGERRRVGAVSAAEAAGPCRQVIRPAPAGPSRGVERGGGAEHRVRLGSSDAGRADVTKVWLDGPQVCWASSRSRTCCYVTNGSSEVHAIVDRPSEWTPARDGSPLTCPQGRAILTNDGEGRMTGEH